jgi:hypothetical protein
MELRLVLYVEDVRTMKRKYKYGKKKKIIPTIIMDCKKENKYVGDDFETLTVGAWEKNFGYCNKLYCTKPC